MHTLRLEVEDTIIDKVLWMLKHFQDEGVVIKEDRIEAKRSKLQKAIEKTKQSDRKEFLSRAEANAR